jgi:Na+-transporting NADH:ubiquinone oxidoreductase subunit C
MSERMKTFLFALSLSVVCSVLLGLVSQTCRPLADRNRRNERKVKTLNVLGIIVPEGATADAVETLYASKITQATDAEGRVIAHIFKNPDTGVVEGLAFPVRGKGLWGPIGGMVALESDLKTILGVRFFDHQETPGLGAEIETDWFQNQFVGKQAVDERGQVLVEVVSPGSAEGPYQVDGISGATITGDGVTELMQRGIKEFLKDYDM